MSITITIRCDDCGETAVPGIDANGEISEPAGWLTTMFEGSWYHTCSACAALYAAETQAEPVLPTTDPTCACGHLQDYHGELRFRCHAVVDTNLGGAVYCLCRRFFAAEGAR